MSENAAELQFETADPVEPGTAEVRCAACGAALASYFEVNGLVACERCKDLAVAARTASHVPTMLRGGALGFLAAILGAILYYAVAELTGYEIGLISVAVGLLVGFAVRKGARGRGGWRYQAIAMSLCYAAICSTYVPRVISAMREQTASDAAKAGQAQPATTAGVPAPDSGAVPASADGGAPPSTAELVRALLFLFGLTLALPFLAGFENIIGLVIIGFALYEAWKINRGTPFSTSGPFAVGAASDG